MSPQTNPSDVFNSQVVIGLVDERLFANTTLLNSGYIGDARNSASISPKGDKVTVVRSVPVEANNKVQTNPRTGTAVAADTVKFDSDDYDVISKILAYDMDERAMQIMANVADPNQFMADEVVKLADAFIQKHLIDAGVAGGIPYPEASGKANWKGLRRAVTKAWGEKNQNSTPLAIVHPDVMFDISTSEGGVFAGTSSIESGKVYSFAGMNFMQLEAIPKSGDVYSNLILLPNALMFFSDREMGYHEQRKAHTTTWQMDWDFAFAGFLTKAKPTGCIVYQAGSTIDAE